MTTPRTDLDEVRAITANYFFWQGLRWIPLGIGLMVVAANLLAPRLFGSMGLLASLVILAAALWMSTTALGGYYRRHFGRVRADPRLHARRDSIKWMVVYPAMLVSMTIDMKLSLPVLISGFVWGASVEAYRRSTGGGRLHYVVAAVACAAFGLLPLGGAVPAGRDGMSVLVGLFGFIYVVGGILDHRSLVRALGRAED
jgi:hypothetical protein